MCLRTDPLLKVMERLANPGIPNFFFCTMWLVLLSMRLTQPTLLMPFGGYMCFHSEIGLFRDQLLFAGTLPDYVFRESTQLLLIFFLFFPFFLGKKR